MDGNLVVHDISSDEDVAFDFAATEGRDNDIDWRDLFVNLESGDAGSNQNCDKDYDSVDVVVVGEVLTKPKKAKKSSAVAKLVAQDLQEDDDDDCVVLDGDPDKPAAVEDPGPDSGGDSDDLVVVAEKGQVACRDYPHPRHLCVKFPFESTQHSDHCTLCHCYVCDSPAPCGNWGNGNLLIDHCHANDKEELWKSERKRAKLEKTASSVVNSTDTSFWRDLLKQIQAPPQFGSHVPFPGPARSFGMPNIIRSQRSAGFSGRPGFQSNLPSQQQINPCSNIPPRARGTSLPYSTPTSIFKRTGQPLFRASVPNRTSNSSYNNFRQAYANNLIGICRASMQVNARHSNTFQSSSAISASQMTSVPIPSQGQVHQYSPPYLHQNGNVSAPLNSTTQSNTSQTSQALAGVSHVEAGQQLPLTGEKSSNGMNPDFASLELDTSFLNDFSDFDFEGEHFVYDMDLL